jgi:hypothetical protein
MELGGYPNIEAPFVRSLRIFSGLFAKLQIVVYGLVM